MTSSSPSGASSRWAVSTSTPQWRRSISRRSTRYGTAADQDVKTSKLVLSVVDGIGHGDLGRGASGRSRTVRLGFGLLRAAECSHHTCRGDSTPSSCAARQLASSPARRVRVTNGEFGSSANVAVKSFVAQLRILMITFQLLRIRYLVVLLHFWMVVTVPRILEATDDRSACTMKA